MRRQKQKSYIRPSSADGSILLFFLVIMLFLSNLSVLFQSSSADPSIQDNGDGTMTGRWTFQNPLNYTYQNLSLSPGKVILMSEYNATVDTTMDDFKQGSVLYNVNITSSPGNVTLNNTILGTPPEIIEVPIDFGNGHDTYIDESFSKKNYGASALLDLDITKITRVLVKFDTSGIQNPQWINRSEVWMKPSPGMSGSIPCNISVHEVTTDWIEGTGTGSPTRDGATWQTTDGNNPWLIPGGDFNAVPEYILQNMTGQTGWEKWNITRLVREWVNGTTPNFGVLFEIHFGGFIADLKAFYSKQYAGPLDRPKLVVYYNASGPSQANGTFISRTIDAQSNVSWGNISWDSIAPAQTDLFIHTRTGDCMGGWSGWSQAYLSSSGSQITSPPNRCLQYKAEMVTYLNNTSPVLEEVRIDYWRYVSEGNIETEDFTPIAWLGWEDFNASFTEPLGTNISFQYSTNAGMFWTGIFAGESLQPLLVQTIRFRADFKSSDQSLTPELYEMNVTYRVKVVLDHIHMSRANWTGTTDEWVDIDATGHNSTHQIVSFIQKWETDDPWGSVNSTGAYLPGMVGSWRVFCNNSDDSISNYTKVTVLPGTRSRIEVSPWDPGTVTTDDALMFNVTGYDSKGNSLGPILANWSVTGGIGTVILGPDSWTILDPTQPGSGQVWADDGLGQANSTNMIQVVAGVRSRIGIEPWSPGVLTTNQSVNLTSYAFDADDNQIGLANVTWTVNGGIGTVNPNSSETSTFTAETPGAGTVSIDDGLGQTNTTDVITVVPGPLFSVGIEPWSPGTLTTDDNVNFTANAYDAGGALIGAISIQWTVGGGIGSIPLGPSINGTFDATTPGVGSITIDDGMGHTNTTDLITVIPGATNRIGINPWSPGTLSAEDNVNFAAYSYDADGNQIGPAIVSWFVNGGIGIIPVGPSQTSVFDATTVGVGMITIDDGMGLTNTTDLIPVIAGQLATIVLDPPSVILLTEEYQNFTAEGYDSDGNSVPLTSPVWETNAGTIVSSSADGAMLQAQDTELSNGWIRVTAVFQNNVTANSTIDVAAVNVKPNIVGTIPSQLRPEDYGSWTLDLSSFASDPQDPLSDLTWFFTDNDPSLIVISGDEVTGNHVIMFTTVKDAYGSDEMTIWLRDSDGQVDDQGFWVNITPVNDNPIIHSITPFTVHYDVPYTYYFYDYVEDVETPKEELVLESSQPQYVSFAGLWGTFTYPVEFNGQTVYPEVTVRDGDGGWRTTVLAITVSEDYVPVLVRELPDVFIFEGEVARDYFDLDDYFDDPDGDSLYYSSGNVNTQIVIHENHSVDFIAPDDWFGVETVSFRAIDPYNARAEDIILVTVLPVNDAPSISGVPDMVVHYDDPSRPNYNYTFDLEPYIYDEDNPISELSISTDDPTHIFFNSSKNSIMEIHYPESMKGQTVVVRITVFDNSSRAYQDINITILENWPPEISSPIPDYELHEDIPLSNAFDLDNHFTDPEGDELSYSSISNNVFVEIDETTSIVSFSSVANWSGFELVTFRAMDIHGAVLEQTIRVTVIPVNDAPVVYPPIPDQELAEGAVHTLNLLNHIFDIDNNFSELDISIVSVHSDATLAIAGSYIIFSFDKEGDYIVQLRVSDGNETAFASFNVRVVGPPAPTIWDQVYWPWSLLVAILALVIAFLLARQFLGKIYIDEAFLIHKDGMLIAHTAIGRGTEMDKDMFSGMLTAIQSFIGDSFREVEDSPVKRIEFGDHKIMIERGKSVYLAVVYSGHENARNIQPMKNAIKEIEKKYSVESVDGSSSEFSGVGEIIEKHLKD